MERKTKIEIEKDRFKINGEFINKGRVWNGIPVEGLLFNTRMVQGIFDDTNPETVNKWAYPDTGIWDAQRNTKEFIEAMPLWKSKGVIGFTLNLQGGSPEGYSKGQPWCNTAFLADGSLDEKYMTRLEKILDKADELGMVPILGYFYFGQDNRLMDEEAILKATGNATRWVLEKGYTNLIIEVDNECNVKDYTHEILKPLRVHELILLVQEISNRKLYAGTSYGGGTVPRDRVIEVSDVLLVHGNGVEDPRRIEQMVLETRTKANYKGQPIVFNEDDHFEFDKDVNNMIMAIKNGASWGYFDPGLSNYEDGYQCPPVNWGINTQRKREFFDLVEKNLFK